MFPGWGSVKVGGLDHRLANLDDLLARWVDAEARGDVAALDALLGPEFRGDGPRGFVFTKQQWLDRYRRGELVNEVYTWQEADVRIHGTTAVVMGLHTQAATYCGRACSGRYQGTLVAVQREDGWSIVNLQLRSLDGRR
jgi:hypothetical protein